MKKKILNRIISLIKEQMTTHSTAGKPGFSSKADAEGPTAGYDPVMGKTQRRQKKFIKLPPGSRKRWTQGTGWVGITTT
jgi:hypothetical protein